MDLSKLNERQRNVVESEADRKAIIAGAGSGKTHTITYVIGTDIERGTEPSEMVAITFTRAASHELKERLERLIGKDALNIHTSTIHSFCLDILDEYIEELGWEEEFNLYDQDDKKDIINGIIKDQNIKITYSKYLKALEEGIDDFDVSLINDEYRDKMQSYNAIDLSMILELTIEVLENDEKALFEVREKYKSFYIDEFQDTNREQLKIIDLINPTKLVVIGDPDQSIYEWNHAKPEYIVNVDQVFEGIEIHKLVDNYRSSNEIIEVANKVIRNNVDRMDKDLIAQFSYEKPRIEFLSGEVDELQFIKDNLSENFSVNAVICRNNKRAAMVADYLVNQDIPVNLISSNADIFKKSEVKKLIKLMWFIHNPDDDYAFMRVVNWPVQRINTKEKNDIERNATSVMSFYQYALQVPNSRLTEFLSKVNTLHQTARKKTVYTLLSDIIDTFDITLSYSLQIRLTRIAEFEKFRREVRRWEIIQQYLRRKTTLNSFLRYTMLRDVQDNRDKERDAVNIMTVHGSKGLEFDTVFIPGVNQSEFPSGRSQNLEEERRLFYVGITRAKRNLFISRASTKEVNSGYTKMTTPSRFIMETGLVENMQTEMEV